MGREWTFAGLNGLVRMGFGESNHSSYIAVLQRSASEKCLLTTPSLLSRANPIASDFEARATRQEQRAQHIAAHAWCFLRQPILSRKNLD